LRRASHFNKFGIRVIYVVDSPERLGFTLSVKSKRHGSLQFRGQL
jgi:hypothetical protein